MEQKNLKKYPEYSIGLDIGTNSVGWAVTDSENNILKHGGKNMWGARLFDEGDTAAQTRTFRGTRKKKRESKYFTEFIIRRHGKGVSKLFSYA